ncbi:MAG: hypothetical protein ABIX01_05235 [Chitinophagaceae bacterium]
MKKQLRFAMIIPAVALLNRLAMAQGEIKPLSNSLQQKLASNGVIKQNELLARIIESSAGYFRKNTGIAFDSGSANMGGNLVMKGKLFDTDLFWPGDEDHSISVQTILKNEKIVHATYSLKFSFTPGNSIDSAKRVFRTVFESINGSLVLFAGAKLVLIAQPFIAVIQDATGRYRSHIEFDQFYKESQVKAVLEFYTENAFFNIDLSFSKVRNNEKE